MPSKWIVQRKLGTFFPRTTTSPAARAARAASARPVLILNLCILHLHSLSCSPFRLRPRYVLVNIENNKVENKMNSRCRGCHRIGYALYIAISRNLKGISPSIYRRSSENDRKSCYLIEPERMRDNILGGSF